MKKNVPGLSSYSIDLAYNVDSIEKKSLKGKLILIFTKNICCYFLRYLIGMYDMNETIEF